MKKLLSLLLVFILVLGLGIPALANDFELESIEMNQAELQILEEQDYLSINHEDIPSDSEVLIESASYLVNDEINQTHQSASTVQSNAPIINSFEVINSIVESPGLLQVKLDITTFDSYVSNISISMQTPRVDEGATHRSLWWSASFDSIGLSSGEHIIDFHLDDSFISGEYLITSISISDRAWNNSWYSLPWNPDGTRDTNLMLLNGEFAFYLDPFITINSELNMPNKAPILLNASIIQAEVSAPGVLQVEFDLISDIGVNSITMGISSAQDENSAVNSLSWVLPFGESALTTGRHIVNFQINPNIESDQYIIQSISINDRAFNGSWYSLPWNSDGTRGTESIYRNGVFAFLFDPFISISQIEITCPAPIINQATILTPSFASPGIMQIEFDLTSEIGIRDIFLGFSDEEDSWVGSLAWRNCGNNSLLTGIHRISFFVPYTFPIGDFRLASISIRDTEGYETWYSPRWNQDGTRDFDAMYTWGGQGFVLDPYVNVTAMEVIPTNLPTITNARILSNESTWVGDIVIELDIISDIGINFIEFTWAVYCENKGDFLVWSDNTEPLTTGKHRFDFTLDPETDISHIIEIRIRDVENNLSYYRLDRDPDEPLRTDHYMYRWNLERAFPFNPIVRNNNMNNNVVDQIKEIAPRVISHGLSTQELVLDNGTLTLHINNIELVLSSSANNRNIAGQIELDENNILLFDIRGNGSNVRRFEIIRR